MNDKNPTLRCLQCGNTTFEIKLDYTKKMVLWCKQCSKRQNKPVSQLMDSNGKRFHPNIIDAWKVHKKHAHRYICEKCDEPYRITQLGIDIEPNTFLMTIKDIVKSKCQHCKNEEMKNVSSD